MPNIMIHEEVGNFISKKLNINSYDYYLGLLAPDAPNLEGFAPKEERWMAHVRKKDLKEWRLSINNFYKQEKDNYSKDFLIGYYIHILTDIIYDDFLYSNIREKILFDGYKLEESHQVMLKDMNKYYFKEINNIKEILKNNDLSYNIQNIDKELLTAWKLKQINNFSTNNTSKYFNSETINKLNNLVYNEVYKNII